jgi:hypothetical protein
MLALSLAACGTKTKEISFIVGYENMNFDFNQNVKSIVNTFDEWDVLKPDHAMVAEFDKYNEQFFADNSIIVLTFIKGNAIDSIQITSIQLKNKQLVVTADVTLTSSEVMSKGLVLAEIKKIDITGANSIKIVSNN